MKTNMNKYIFLLGSVLSLLFVSCHGLNTDFETEWTNPVEGEGAIQIVLGDDCRTAFPNITAQTEWKWTLEGAKDGGDKQFLKTWEVGQAVANAITAPIGVKAGSWVFYLKAERIVETDDGNKVVTTYSGTSAGTTIAAGEATQVVSISLKLTQIDTDISGNGALEIEVKYTSSKVTKIEACLYKLPSFDNTAGALVAVEGYSPVDITATKKYILSDVTAGRYVAGFNFYNGSNKLNANPYEEYVYIVKGAKSESTVNVNSLDDVYTISYQPAPDSAPGSYTRHSDTITLPAAGEMDTSDSLFCGWYDNSNYTGTPVVEIPAGSRGNKKLYAKYISKSYAETLPESLSLKYADYNNPSETGKPRVGNTILLDGTITANCTYQWSEGASASNEWTDISGATNSSYKIAASNVGNNLRFTATKHKSVKDYPESGDLIYHVLVDEDSSVSAVLGGTSPVQVLNGILNFSSVTIQYSGTVLAGDKPQKSNLILSGTLKDIYGNEIKNSDLQGQFEENSALASSKTLNVTVNVPGYEISGASPSVFVTVKANKPEGSSISKVGTTYQFSENTIAMGLEYSLDEGSSWQNVTASSITVESKVYVRYPSSGNIGQNGYVMASDMVLIYEVSAIGGGTAAASSKVMKDGNDLNSLFTASDKPFRRAVGFERSETAPVSDDEAEIISTENGDGAVYAWVTPDRIIKVYANITEDTLITMNQNCINMFSNMNRLEYVDFTGFDMSRITNVAYMFQNCSSLEEITWDGSLSQNYPDPNEVINYSGITNMSCMFENTTSLETVDLSMFHTESVSDMSGMFADSGVVELEINFNSSKVTDFSDMFSNCESLSSITFGPDFIGNSAENLSYMFAYCISLEQLNLENFVVEVAEDMSCMFAGMKNLTSIDISSITVSEDAETLPNLSKMFNGDEKLTKIYTSSTADWTECRGSKMFTGCVLLTGGNGTVYSTSQVSSAYAIVDGLSDEIGYFTAKQQ